MASVLLPALFIFDVSLLPTFLAALLLLLGILPFLSIGTAAESFTICLALPLLGSALHLATFSGATALTLLDVGHYLLQHGPMPPIYSPPWRVGPACSGSPFMNKGANSTTTERVESKLLKESCHGKP
ncbi:hypothetical protein C1930_09090 [Stenotrophomonas sp. SAU14A_NAIMI4_8]|nr:hypothetical protein C1931_08810 [Stenotrophomonas sp. YAU14A_MKIMI4_1]AWH33000.1 hypothetical protein C1930_09090 [Stenotrophomonas sp. SAU14A_NAIMI4_8]